MDRNEKMYIINLKHRTDRLEHILKELETKHEERVKSSEEKKIETQKPADAESVFKNPGAVSYDDIQAYLKKKQSERYLVQELPKKE